jgi:hypothetical protein
MTPKNCVGADAPYNSTLVGTQLERDEFADQFQRYRTHLSMEIHRFWDSASIYRQIPERTQDHLAKDAYR